MIENGAIVKYVVNGDLTKSVLNRDALTFFQMLLFIWIS